MNITLEIKGAVTSIEVSGEAPALDMTTPNDFDYIRAAAEDCQR